MAWLDDFLSERERLADAGLAADLEAEIREAMAGAAWFLAWPESARRRWAASLVEIAHEDNFALSGDVREWLEALAEGGER